MQMARRLVGGSGWLALIVIVAASVAVVLPVLWRDVQGFGAVWQIGDGGICETSEVDPLGPTTASADGSTLVFRAQTSRPVEAGHVLAVVARYEIVVLLVAAPLFVYLLARLVRLCMGDPSGWGRIKWR
jgi:hypothetical protein